MDSGKGYEYCYRFSMVYKDEIYSVYKLHLNLGNKAFLFEFRTNFILRRRLQEGVDDTIIDSERYDARVYEGDDGISLYFVASYRLKGDDGISLYFVASYRLKEYWMTADEMELLFNEAFACAKQMAANPEHVSLNLIPIVVDLEVCTMQRDDNGTGLGGVWLVPGLSC